MTESNPSVNPPTNLTVGTLRALLTGLDDHALVFIGTMDSGLMEWIEEECQRVAIAYNGTGALYVTLEGQR